MIKPIPLDTACAMVARGLSVVRVYPNAKKPVGDDWGDRSTKSPEVISTWPANSNYGIMPRDGIIILDLDPPKEPGEPTVKETWDRLKPTPTQTHRTPSGGLHVLYRLPPGVSGEDIENSIKTVIPGVDVFAHGSKQVVGPGSEINGRRYEILHDRPIAELPAHILKQLLAPHRPKIKPKSAAPGVKLGEPPALERARDYLDAAPGVGEGERNPTCFRLAAKIKDFGVTRDQALGLILAWSAKCDPPMEVAEVQTTVNSSWKNGKNEPGCDARSTALEDFEIVLDAETPGEAPIEAPAVKRLLLEFARDISLDALIARQDHALIKGVLHPRDMAVLYGESRAGKSFIGLDLAFHIALGLIWHGRKVTRAPVLYVALEGEDGFRKRILAALKALGDPGPWFARLNIHVSLAKATAGEQGLKLILEAANQLRAATGHPVGAIIVDTYARATAGDDENAADTVMAYVDKRAGVIQRLTGAAVLTVAHTNRSGDLRGSLHLRNAADVVLKAERHESETSGVIRRSLLGEKVKDGAEETLFDFQLEPVELGEDAEGIPVTSCIVRTSAPDPKKEKPKKERTLQRTLRAAFEAVRAENGEASAAKIREAFFERYATGDDDPKKAEANRRQAWSRALRSLPDGLETFQRDGIDFVRSQNSASAEFEIIGDHENAA